MKTERESAGAAWTAPGQRKDERKNTEREKSYQHWLISSKGCGQKKKRMLLQKLGSAEEVYKASPRAVSALLGEAAAEKLAESKKNWNILEEYEKLQEQKIKFTCCTDGDYPRRLKKIPDAPFSLYYRGHLPAEQMPAAALIGARACSEYGIYAAKEFGSKLAGIGIQIISGLAVGIDSIAQEAALAAGGESFGVLGCGVDICYPKSSRLLYERCRRQGGVLSEYPPGTKPQGFLFPARNRIISGLSDVVIVVEAREKSGTLITVDMALEQGKEVLAVPGRITDTLSRGCNNLFRQGAGVAVSPLDAVEALQGFFHSINIEETARKSGEKMPPGRQDNLINTLSKQEKQVYKSLEVLPKTPEELFLKMDGILSIQEVMGILVELTLKGLAKQGAEGYSIGNDK